MLSGDIRNLTVYNRELTPDEVTIVATQFDEALLKDAAPSWVPPEVADIAPEGYSVCCLAICAVNCDS